MRQKLTLLALLGVFLSPVPVSAQQTGTISGKVTATDGAVLPGVTIEVRSTVLPGPRTALTGATGEYRLPALPPGDYSVKFTLSGMRTMTRQAQVQLLQDTVVDAQLSVEGVAEEVTVTASSTLIDRDTATIKSGLSNEQIRALPVGQEYRDIIKLIPSVQYTQDTTRGPSAGGSGQDNLYQFDGVNVTLPLFGTLSAEPAAHDIAQVTTIKGGARAVDFDRSGGFSIDSVSKSGTSRLTGMASYQLQNNQMAADLKTGSLSRYEQDRGWVNLNAGGPIVPNKVFFYGSYYRPNYSRDNRANVYGDLPPYESNRNEGFGKVTVRPTSSVLFNFSYRDSHRLDTSDLFPANAASTTGSGGEAWLNIGTLDGSWVIDSRTYATMKYTYFANKTQSRPDNVANVTISTAPGTRLNTASLNTQGRFQVPQPIANQTAFNTFIQPLIDTYGFISEQTGQRTGGGIVGYDSLFDKDDFFRDGIQFGLNRTFGTAVSHEVHVGYQWYSDAEDLTRSSNGWGTITVPGGRLNFQGTPIFYTAAFQQQGTGAVVPTIHSEYRSQSFEINDNMRWGRFSFNAGLLVSNDTLYGQGLKEDASALSGYVASTGTTPEERRYKMYEVPFSKMLQPRLGATWAYNGRDTVFLSFSKYNPAASSLPRAASWDRNLATTINAHFDANGVLFGVEPVASSSGKLFVADMTPRRVNEVLYGTARQFNNRWTGRLYGRYRSGSHFWEDTNNTARVAFNPPATVHGESVPREPYIADLTQRLAQIGSGSTYVIAELDGAYTKFYEVTMESEWRTNKVFVRGSYSWSHYYGNFDQDSSGVTNDANVFIGSSNIGDGAGRQLWDMRDGDLRGDRRHLFKIYGYYAIDVPLGKFRWNATAGAFVVAQSGQPWESWSYEPYRSLTTSTSDTARFAEPAGSRHTAGHAQVDLNYTQTFPISGRLTAQLALDLFNVGNSQTGYNFQPAVHLSTFNQPRNYFDPRRFQAAVRLQF